MIQSIQINHRDTLQMKKLYLLLTLLFVTFQVVAGTTNRLDQFSNDQVKVWKTVIYPSSQQALPMHRHEHNRVLIALTDGTLKITNNKGKVSYLKLKKDTAYYFTKDPEGELHNDENLSKQAIKVMVVELN